MFKLPVVHPHARVPPCLRCVSPPIGWCTCSSSSAATVEGEGSGRRWVLLALKHGLERSIYTPNRLVEDALQVALCEGRALEVLLRLDLLGDHDCLLVLDGGHLLLAQRLLGSLVVSQIELGADEDDGDARCVVVDLGVPLGPCQLGERRQWLLGLTLALTLSNDGGLTMEKQMRNTSVWGYESGRSRS